MDIFRRRKPRAPKDRDGVNIVCKAQLRNFSRCYLPIHSRHLIVHENGLKKIALMGSLFGLQNSFFHQLKRLLSVIGLDHFLLEAFEQLLQDKEVVWLVIHDEHLILEWAAP